MEITKSSENQENSIVIQDRRECLLEHHYKSLKNIPMYHQIQHEKKLSAYWHQYHQKKINI